MRFEKWARQNSIGLPGSSNYALAKLAWDARGVVTENESRDLPVCPVCYTSMHLKDRQMGNGCGEYWDECIWLCECEEEDLLAYKRGCT